ncbi:hypothetical protein H0H93_010307, partial [Arthromyces matolae]
MKWANRLMFFFRSADAPSPASREQNELPPVEMPLSPGVYTPHYHGVGRVPLQVLGWTVEGEYLIRWMEKFAPRPDFTISQKRRWAHMQIPRKLPRGYHKYAT